MCCGSPLCLWENPKSTWQSSFGMLEKNYKGCIVKILVADLTIVNFTDIVSLTHNCSRKCEIVLCALYSRCRIRTSDVARACYYILVDIHSSDDTAASAGLWLALNNAY